ncbi:DUF2306 domain-containing protein [Amorphus sp. MBR-141]
MTLAPLIAASPAIQLHTVVALSAFFLGLLQVVGPKGRMIHRALGWIWVVLMAVVAVSAFFIHELRVWGDWSPIHLLAVVVLVALPFGVMAARRHDVNRHRRTMLGLFLGALVIAGAFTFAPGRLMHALVFG